MDLMLLAYKETVWQQLEYSPYIWDPTTKKMDINKIEMIQQKAARYVMNRYENLNPRHFQELP